MGPEVPTPIENVSMGFHPCGLLALQCDGGGRSGVVSDQHDNRKGDSYRPGLETARLVIRLADGLRLFLCYRFLPVSTDRSICHYKGGCPMLTTERLAGPCAPVTPPAASVFGLATVDGLINNFWHSWWESSGFRLLAPPSAREHARGWPRTSGASQRIFLAVRTAKKGTLRLSG
jgi:hypothetical protein